MKLKSQAERGLNLNSHRLVNFIDDFTNQTLKHHNIDLSNSQYLVLKSIFILGEVSQKDISDFIGTSEPAVSRHCKSLADKKYIEINNIANRSYKVKISPEGKKMLKKSFKKLDEELKERIEGYDMLSEALNKFFNN